MTIGLNEYGRVVTWMTCTTCRRPFSVTGEHTEEDWGTGCLMPDCETYDVERDAGLLFDIEPWRISVEVADE